MFLRARMNTRRKNKGGRERGDDQFLSVLSSEASFISSGGESMDGSPAKVGKLPQWS